MVKRTRGGSDDSAMRDGMREQGAGALDAAGKRLERALGLLETRVNRRLKRIEQMEAQRAGGEGGSDRAQLLAELDAARARERALESIAAEASAALGRAAEEVRAALAEDRGSESPATAPAGSDPAEGVATAAPDDASLPTEAEPVDDEGADLYPPQAAAQG